MCDAAIFEAADDAPLEDVAAVKGLLLDMAAVHNNLRPSVPQIVSVEEIGSTAKGTAIRGSDLDVVIFFDVPLLDTEDEIRALLKDVVMAFEELIARSGGTVDCTVEPRYNRYILLSGVRLGERECTVNADICVGSSAFLQSAPLPPGLNTDLNNPGFALKRRDAIAGQPEAVRVAKMAPPHLATKHAWQHASPCPSHASCVATTHFPCCVASRRCAAPSAG
jgi:predicted nucleotidyltransferase